MMRKWFSFALATVSLGCRAETPQVVPAGGEGDMYRRLEVMVSEQIEARGVKDAATLAAMRRVPRWEFVPPDYRGCAFEDNPLPIGEGQTISQPYIVAYMTAALGLDADDRVLEIGTGSGYQAAILSLLAAEVYTIEIVEPLGRQAEATLARLGYDNVHVRIGDGYRGWPEAAPFDAIIVTCAPDHVPQPLLDQLKEGGRLVIPVGSKYPQVLKRYTRHGDEFTEEVLEPVLFVPMTGEAMDK